MKPTTLFRYVDKPTLYNKSRCIDLIIYIVIKETPKGYWIKQELYNKKWISKERKYPYASECKAEALTNFKARKLKHLRILEKQVSGIKNVIKQIETVNGTSKYVGDLI